MLNEIPARVRSLETRFDTILPTLATKADIAQVESRLIKWVAGIGIASITVMLSVISFMFSHLENISLNQVNAHAIAPSPAPNIINIPSLPNGQQTPPTK